MKLIKHKKLLHLLFISIILLISIFFINKRVNIIDKKENKIKFLNQKIDKIDRITNIEIQYVKSNILKSNNLSELHNNNNLKKLFKKYGVIINIFRKDSLIFWTDNSVELPPYLIRQKNNIVRLSNGWYKIITANLNDYKIIKLILIKFEYPYENEFLNNNFNPAFKINVIKNENEIQNKITYYNYIAKDISSVFNPSEKLLSGRIWIDIIYCFYLGFLVLIIIILYYLSRVIFVNKLKALFIFIIELIILFFLTINFKIPGIFNNKIISYPNSNHVSIYDYLINYSEENFVFIFLLINIIIIIFYNITNKDKKLLSKLNNIANNDLIKSTIITILILIIFGFFSYIDKLIIKYNTKLDFSNVLNIEFVSLIDLLNISLYFSIIFLLINQLYKINSFIITKKTFIFLLIFNILLSLLVIKIDGESKISVLFLTYIIVLTNLLLINSIKRIINFKWLLFINIILFSACSTFLHNKVNNEMDFILRKQIAKKQTEEKDIILENEYLKIIKELKKDKDIIEAQKKIMNEKEEEYLKECIKGLYFQELNKNYNIQITICKESDSLIIKPDNIKIGCYEYFFNIVRQTGSENISNFTNENLIKIQREYVINSYLGIINYKADSLKNLKGLRVFIEIDSKFIPKDLGYPKLFLDNKLQTDGDISNYCYAKYINNKLVFKYGKYNYSYQINKEEEEQTLNFNLSNNIYNNDSFFKENKIFKSNGFEHIVYKPNSKTTIIVSKEVKTKISKIAPFSYFVCIFSLMIFFVLILSGELSFLNIKKQNLRLNLQYSFFILLIFSFIIIGSFSLLYFIHNNNNRNEDFLSDKSFTILAELENDLTNYEKLNVSMYDNLYSQLIHLSDIHFTDINIFGLNGKLIAGSRNKIYNEGLISQYINPDAFYHLIYNKKVYYVQNEKIGALVYYSAYTPIRNVNNQIIGFLNIPYFAKQSVFKNEISVFITTFLNIIIIIALISLLTVYFISNYIAKPLRILENKLATINLASVNQKIEWDRNDELGSLINQYNIMVDKLHESAELLSKSERESAWREMAKQVAHDIKNPLTPIKLNIQFFQKSLNKEPIINKDKLDKLFNIILEQIDTLAFIADEFTDLAKMSNLSYNKINLCEVINNAVYLFKNNDTHKIFTSFSVNQAFVIADYKQLSRAFINIIKNALQATESIENPEIKIKLSLVDNYYLIEFADNGIGIYKEAEKRIFEPYFTTKTEGTGLGLAIVKSIITSSGGEIWFESCINNGTIFFIKLKIA